MIVTFYILKCNKKKPITILDNIGIDHSRFSTSTLSLVIYDLFEKIVDAFLVSEEVVNIM